MTINHPMLEDYDCEVKRSESSFYPMLEDYDCEETEDGIVCYEEGFPKREGFPVLENPQIQENVIDQKLESYEPKFHDMYFMDGLILLVFLGLSGVIVWCRRIKHYGEKIDGILKGFSTKKN